MNFSKKISSNIVLIKGQGYFSDFRLNSLLERINGLGVDANSVDCRECFIISFKDKFKNVNARDIQRLKSVLNSANDQSISTENSFLITPRKGTFSPWSSKAQDIFNNCGISCIERIERGLFYTLVSKEPIPGSALESIGQDLADRMTESVIVDLEKISSFFSEQEKLSFKTIPILTEGKEALKEANEILGLALNDDEIQYLYSN